MANNKEIIYKLQFWLDDNKNRKATIEQSLLNNFNYRFSWDCDKLLRCNQIIDTLTKILNAESDKKEHLTFFIKQETERIFSYDCSNKSTSTLSNYQKEIEIETTKELIRLFKDIINDNNNNK